MTTTMTSTVSRSNIQSIITSQCQAYIKPGQPGNIHGVSRKSSPVLFLW